MSDKEIMVKPNWGGSFLSLLTLLFIGLKLAGVITWSWWWVLAPMWGPVALAVAVVALCLLGAFLCGLIEYFLKK